MTTSSDVFESTAHPFVALIEPQQDVDPTASLSLLSDALRRVTHFNHESSRLIPGLAVAMANHAKDLQALQKRVALLDQRAAACRQRSLALAQRYRVDVSALRLHDRDAELEEAA